MTSIFTLPLEQADPMQVAAYDYALPEELIAAHPEAQRERSRMLLLDLSSGQMSHRHFGDITQALRAGDRLVFNDSRVIPGRLMLTKETGGRVELLVLERLDAEAWEQEATHDAPLRLRGMYRSSNSLKPGQTLTLDDEEPARVRVLGIAQGQVEVAVEGWTQSARLFLERFGQLPLPPYILKRRRESGEQEYIDEDRARYQTVLADKLGAIAAPTAGLHFSEALLAELGARGVEVSRVTLHVGPGTFKPMKGEQLHDHQMHQERYEVSEALAGELEATRRAGGRIIAVGTTSARVLESEARKPEPFLPGVYTTELFLYPGHGPRLCDGLVTNFHLPNSTLLTLVASATGYAQMRRIYEEALKERYRFYSYGDGMLILNIPHDEPVDEARGGDDEESGA